MIRKHQNVKVIYLGLSTQSINQFNSGDVAHTRTRETDEQTEAADRKNSTTQKHTKNTQRKTEKTDA